MIPARLPQTAVLTAFGGSAVDDPNAWPSARGLQIAAILQSRLGRVQAAEMSLQGAEYNDEGHAFFLYLIVDLQRLAALATADGKDEII